MILSYLKFPQLFVHFCVLVDLMQSEEVNVDLSWLIF